MIVHVGSILHAYTGGASRVEVDGQTVGEVLDALERDCPGVRFRIVDEQDRIRPHVRVYVGETPALGLDTPVGAHDEVHVLAALSGG